MQHSTTIKVTTRKGSERPFTMKFEEDAPAETVAVQVAAKVTRSKIFPPGGTAEFWINNRDTAERGPAGVDLLEECVRIGLRTEVIKRDGAWYQIPTAPKVQGRERMVAQLRAQPQLAEVIREQIFSREKA
jgi:hypothetical protein